MVRVPGHRLWIMIRQLWTAVPDVDNPGLRPAL
jgi:hypothetical protein